MVIHHEERPEPVRPSVSMGKRPPQSITDWLETNGKKYSTEEATAMFGVFSKTGVFDTTPTKPVRGTGGENGESDEGGGGKNGQGSSPLRSRKMVPVETAVGVGEWGDAAGTGGRVSPAQKSISFAEPSVIDTDFKVIPLINVKQNHGQVSYANQSTIGSGYAGYESPIGFNVTEHEQGSQTWSPRSLSPRSPRAMPPSGTSVTIVNGTYTSGGGGGGIGVMPSSREKEGIPRGSPTSMYYPIGGAPPRASPTPGGSVNSGGTGATSPDMVNMTTKGVNERKHARGRGYATPLSPSPVSANHGILVVHSKLVPPNDPGKVNVASNVLYNSLLLSGIPGEPQESTPSNGQHQPQRPSGGSPKRPGGRGGLKRPMGRSGGRGSGRSGEGGEEGEGRLTVSWGTTVKELTPEDDAYWAPGATLRKPSDLGSPRCTAVQKPPCVCSRCVRAGHGTRGRNVAFAAGHSSYLRPTTPPSGDEVILKQLQKAPGHESTTSPLKYRNTVNGGPLAVKHPAFSAPSAFVGPTTPPTGDQGILKRLMMRPGHTESPMLMKFKTQPGHGDYHQDGTKPFRH